MASFENDANDEAGGEELDVLLSLMAQENDENHENSAANKEVESVAPTSGCVPPPNTSESEPSSQANRSTCTKFAVVASESANEMVVFNEEELKQLGVLEKNLKESSSSNDAENVSLVENEGDVDETAFYSALGDDLELGGEEGSLCVEHDKTLSPSSQEPSSFLAISGSHAKLKNRKTEQIRDELRTMQQRTALLEEELKRRQTRDKPPASSSGKRKTGGADTGTVAVRRDAPIDFGASTTAAPSVGDGRNQSLLHTGDTSSSEDEFNRNQNTEERQLSTEGRKFKKTLTQRNTELSNRGNLQPNSSVPLQNKDVETAPLREKALNGGKRIDSDGSLEIAPKGASCGVFGTRRDLAPFYDDFFRIRISTPKISSSVFGNFEGERFKLSQMRAGWKGLDVDWITLGVLVEKTLTKTSSNGNSYSIWQVSDLRDIDKEIPVKLFLFGEALNTHWKVSVATAVVIKNPAVMDDSENKGSKQEIKLRLTTPNNLVEIGHCPDFSICRGSRKSDGKQCGNFVNKSQSEYCTFHVYAASKKFAAKRGELQGSGSRPPKSWEKKVMGEHSSVFYGGQSMSKPMKAPHVTKAMLDKKKPNLLMEAASKREKLESRETQKSEENPLMSVLTLPTAGARNLLKHIGADHLQSLTKTEEGEKKKKLAAQQAISGRKFLEGIKSRERREDGGKGKSSQSAARNKMPMLGRGLKKDAEVMLEVELPEENRHEKKKLDKAGMKALNVLRRNGPLAKSDPNAIPGSRRNISAPERNKRQRAAVTVSSESSSSRVMNGTGGSATTSPVKKRSKLGGATRTKEEMMAIANKKSSHHEELEEEDVKRQELYFKLMEAKEMVETKMVETTEIKNCRVVTCKKCDYTWHGQSELCKRQGHLIQRHSADKRFFKCKTCSTRTLVYDQKIPKKACRKCGETTKWERVGMRDERKGPQLDAQSLKVRGDEEPFLNR